MDRVKRRGNIARALGRLREVMRRRQPATVRDERKLKLISGPANECSMPENSPDCHNSAAYTSVSPESERDQQLEADDDDDLEETLLPIAQHRSGISDSKARDLFSRYGLLYAQRPVHEDGPLPQLRRVERPIRIRVHWTCHACKTRFGMGTTCNECGHHRCAVCPRDPAKHMQEVMENGRRIMPQNDFLQQGSMPPGNATSNSANHSPTLEQSFTIEADNEAGLFPFEYTLDSRSLAATRMFEVDQYQVRRIQRPRSLGTGDRTQSSTMFHTITNGEIAMTRAAVRRVYRKPRQRVRFTCEHCSTVLVEGGRCRECDHNVFLRSP